MGCTIKHIERKNKISNQQPNNSCGCGCNEPEPQNDCGCGCEGNNAMHPINVNVNSSPVANNTHGSNNQYPFELLPQSAPVVLPWNVAAAARQIVRRVQLPSVQTEIIEEELPQQIATVPITRKRFFKIHQEPTWY